MTFQKQILLSFALGTSVLSLGACGFSHPNAMPSGYTHHHETYKSPAPAMSSKVTVEQREYMNAEQAEQFRDAVYDLLERLTMRAGMPPKPVYILAPDPMTTFYANIDNDLRESMRHIGYAISDTSNDAYIFTYEASSLSANNMQNNVQMTLKVFSGLGESDKQLTEETGQYFIQGAEALGIVPSLYSALPTPKRAEIEPVILEPVLQAPIEAVVTQPVIIQEIIQPPLLSEPVVSVPPPAQALEIEPVVEVRPVVEKPIVISKPDQVEPSHSDIVIINRGDKPSVEVTIPEPQENMLHKAIPRTENIIRGRVSNPADY